MSGADIGFVPSGAQVTAASTMLTSPVLIDKALANSCRLTSSNKVSSKPCLVRVIQNRQTVLWSGTPLRLRSGQASPNPKLMKRRNIKSRANCFSNPGPLKSYQLCSNKAFDCRDARGWAMQEQLPRTSSSAVTPARPASWHGYPPSTSLSLSSRSTGRCRPALPRHRGA